MKRSTKKLLKWGALIAGGWWLSVKLWGGKPSAAAAAAAAPAPDDIAKALVPGAELKGAISGTIYSVETITQGAVAVPAVVIIRDTESGNRWSFTLARASEFVQRLATGGFQVKEGTLTRVGNPGDVSVHV